LSVPQSHWPIATGRSNLLTDERKCHRHHPTGMPLLKQKHTIRPYSSNVVRSCPSPKREVGLQKENRSSVKSNSDGLETFERFSILQYRISRCRHSQDSSQARFSPVRMRKTALFVDRAVIDSSNHASSMDTSGLKVKSTILIVSREWWEVRMGCERQNKAYVVGRK
jgi:hypothetical protein